MSSPLSVPSGASFVGSMRRVCGYKNFSRAWVDGPSNQKTSNITDHAKSELHKTAMMCFRAPLGSYAFFGPALTTDQRGK